MANAQKNPPGLIPLMSLRTQSSSVLVNTAQQVHQQFLAVRTLSEQNFEYLTDIEKSWIEHILSCSERALNAVMYLTEPIAGKLLTQRKWLPDTTFFQQLKQFINDAPVATDDLTQLLVSAKSLNSALSLLSICYDRWKWQQSCNGVSIANNSETSSDELGQFLNRRRQMSDDRVERLTRLASVCLQQGQQPRATHSHPDCLKPGIRPNMTTSTLTNEPDSRLSMIIVESVDKWRQNAEDALLMMMMTTTSTPSNLHDQPRGQDEHNFAISGSDGTNISISSASDTDLASNRVKDFANRGTKLRTPAVQPFAGSRTDVAEPVSPSLQHHPTLGYYSTLPEKPNSIQSLRRKPVSFDSSTKSPASTPNHSSADSKIALPTCLLSPVTENVTKEMTDNEDVADNRYGDNISNRLTISPQLISPSESRSTRDGQHKAPVSTVSHGSSTSSFKSPNASPASFDMSQSHMMPSLIAPQRISRGRAWLEERAAEL